MLLELDDFTGRVLFTSHVYLPIETVWKIPSSHPNTGTGRLMSVGRKNGTVLGEYGASIVLILLRPGLMKVSSGP